jgi:hypothetical protein
MRDYWIAPCAITICSKCGSRYAEALMMKAIGEVGCSAFLEGIAVGLANACATHNIV